jgi:hypothetical protein
MREEDLLAGFEIEFVLNYLLKVVQGGCGGELDVEGDVGGDAEDYEVEGIWKGFECGAGLLWGGDV